MMIFINWTISGQCIFTIHKLFIYNGLTNDIRTENPRVGGSIPSRPTTLKPINKDFCGHPPKSPFFYL